MNRKYKLLWLLLILPASLWAQTPDYEAAEYFDAPNLQRQIGTTQVIPFFLKKSNKFWFSANGPAAGGLPPHRPMKGQKIDIGNDADERVTTDYGINATSPPSLNVFSLDKDNYYLVDPDKKQKIVLFDKVAIAQKLQELTKGEPSRTSVTYSPQFSNDEKTVQVGYNGETYDYNYTTKTLLKQVKKGPQKFPVYHTGTISPDKKWLLYSRHHNLYIKGVNTDTAERVLANDGAEYHSFSINELDKYAGVNGSTDAVWTPDSKSFYVLRKDTRKVQTLSVFNSASNFGRPYLTTYKYELPGDADVAQYEFYVGNAAAHTLKKVNIDRWPDQQVEVLRNQTSNGEVFILRKKRSRDEMELCAVDLNTGALRVVINEVSKPFINMDMFNVSIINGGKDILWWSDRTGWGQYYHYDRTGRLLNSVTQGDWTAGKIVATDSAKKVVYFYGYGKEKGRNPNYAFLYKVGLDGRNQQLLTPEDATHAVFMSPNKNYFVDYFSRIDLEPVTIVRNTEGKYIQEVLKPDFSKLYAYGWKQPEMFTVKAKDGVTDLYGLMWKPFNFDPNKKYPIISQVYPGPFIETVWNEFTVTDRYNNTSLAQTGFVVVVMGHRGSSPYRNAAYYKFGYGNLRDYALEDDKYGLEQLAARYNFIDLNRVGIFGHSGGGMMSTAALCTYPGFYKVAVSSSGNHDNTIYNRTWGETYNGYGKKIDVNQSLAKNLRGHLMLVTGESDQNVNPAGTYRMVDALIKADKDFDLLVLPGQSHTYEEPYKTYFQRRLRQYFAKYLMEK
ncbi:DPP IV N-terminal domain-containing protein [Pedobacter sp. MC2016-14]|uniref:S9 family peptidase n=1 Tax=Pedobacter sp. MC2016-14 TaxID=2897327 RepID=UPI001E301F17|nr:DPP IV N-terminal domain-containing protein [Pedobacter sp. MC2016-14]MCD0489197.1 DPP IV N-terminal domain-containing protein [Pedobacter sp. MC2016-14]